MAQLPGAGAGPVGFNHVAVLAWPSANAISEVIETNLQSFGFSLNPPEKPGELENYRKLLGISEQSSTNLFWTDWMPLDEMELRKLGLTREALRLSPTPRIHYAYQIIGSWQCDFPENSMQAHLSKGLIRQAQIVKAPTKFRVCMQLKKRGEASDFIPDRSAYNSTAVVEKLFKGVEEGLRALVATPIPSATY